MVTGVIGGCHNIITRQPRDLKLLGQPVVWQMHGYRLMFWPRRHIFTMFLWYIATWSWSTLAQVMTWCLTAPSHYLNHGWLIINRVLWRSSKNKFRSQEELKISSRKMSLKNTLVNLLSYLSRANEMNQIRLRRSDVILQMDNAMFRYIAAFR